MNRPSTGTLQANPVTPQPPSSARVPVARSIIGIDLRPGGQKLFGEIAHWETSAETGSSLR